MNVLKITANDYDNNTASNNISKTCTKKEKYFDIIKPTLFLTIPCGLSFLCLIGLKMYTLIKLLLNNK